MTWYKRVGLGLAIGLGCIQASPGQETPGRKARVEFFWVESSPVEGLTEGEGFQTSCDPDSLAYPHRKPVLVAGADVAEPRIIEHDLSRHGLGGLRYDVSLRLTEKAAKALAEGCGDRKTRLLTIAVDGKPWGIQLYRKSDAGRFAPSVGYFSSKFDAERTADAFR